MKAWTLVLTLINSVLLISVVGLLGGVAHQQPNTNNDANLATVSQNIYTLSGAVSDMKTQINQLATQNKMTCTGDTIGIMLNLTCKSSSL